MENIDQFIEESTVEKSSNGIFEKNGEYYVRKIDEEGNPKIRRITNFTIKIISSHHRDDGIYREIAIKGNKITARRMIAPTEMFDGFKSFVASCGNFSWWGNAMDLTNLWNHLYSQDEGKVIYEPECIGWQEDHSLFMFENVAFKGLETIKPDQHGTYWVDGTGIRPRSISTSKSDIPEGLPFIITNRHLDIAELRSKLQDSMSPTLADHCLGWACSVLFMEEVFERFGNFPFLFITGKRRSGKSTIAEWLTYLFGFESAGRMWSDTTPIAISRYLGYYSSLPLWLDEYRNDSKYANKTGMLRNVYNRQTSGKGTRDGFNVREAKIRGTVIISGEETPDDNALLTRCVVIQMAESYRTTNHFNWFTDNKRLLSNFTYQILSDKENTKKKFIENLVTNKESLSNKGFDERLSINKAVVATGFEHLFGEDKQFASSIFETATQDSKSQEEESAVSVFFNDIGALVFSKTISHNYWTIKDGFMYIYFHGLYNEWAIDYRKRRGEPPFKLQSLRGYLAEEKGFVTMSVNYRMDDNSVRSCVKFQIESCEEYIKQLAAK